MTMMKHKPSSQSLPIPTNTHTVENNSIEDVRWYKNSVYEDKDNRRNGYLITTIGDSYVRLFDLRWNCYIRRSINSFIRNYVRVVLDGPDGSMTQHHYSEGGTMWDEIRRNEKRNNEYILKNKPREWIQQYYPDLLK